MKKCLYAVIAALLVLASCNNSLVPRPVVPESQIGSGAAIPPENVSASHGEKRTITLSWEQKPNTLFYYIYRANSPLDSFARCGETASNQISFSVQPGSTMYYRVSAVSSDNRESSQSAYVRGTSLAQPVITDITDITETGASVAWYMDNVAGDTYKNNLLYIVYCFFEAAEIGQVVLDASLIQENRAFFEGLNANTRYEYQVEAYLRSDQGASEKSDRMDAATARRFRPGAPINLKAAHGSNKEKITLSFELPETVDVSLGDNVYDPKPLYFVISKRQYSETVANPYQIVCAYFGSVEATALEKNGKIFDASYIPGALVTWEDTGIRRGVKYEYQVQAYVDGTPKLISSDSSKANAVGWALSEGTLSFGKAVYTLNEAGTEYIYAKLPLIFEFDPMGEAYRFVLLENVEAVDDPPEANDPDNSLSRKIPDEDGFETYDDIRAYIPEMNLSEKTTEQNPGRGLYSYEVQIMLDGETLDTVKTIGKIEISENTQPIVVESFYVQDGYTNKFIFLWPNQSNRKYVLYESESAEGPFEAIKTINENPGADEGLTVIDNFTCIADGYERGITRYFAIRPFRVYQDGFTTVEKGGQMVYFPAASRTLGVPRLLPVSGYSYSTITAVWEEAQKADAYRLKYKYADEAEWREAAMAGIDELIVDANDNFNYSFKPDGYNDVTKAGKEIQLQVEALNLGLQAEVGGEIAAASEEDVRARLVGPALLALSASEAVSATQIDISWNPINGAGGYYIFRRQFNMNNTAEDGFNGNEAVVYYVPAELTPSVPITGKNLQVDGANSKADTLTVKAAASFEASRYTLKDVYMTDNEYDFPYYWYTPVYKNQQNNMAQGYPYRYYIVPVLAGEPLTSIEFAYAKDGSNNNTNITSYTIQENGANITLSGAAALERRGFTIGFGQNVTATKGTYKSSSVNNVNDGIRITWANPPLLNADGLNYGLYRRAPGGAWENLRVENLTEREYIDVPQIRGVAYEYAVGIGNSSGDNSQPQYSRRFIDLCYTMRDEKNRPDMLGYQLDLVKMQEVSRVALPQEADGHYPEEVKWWSAGIKNLASSDNNWGIDGYEVFVMNRNIDAGWHKIADISAGSGLIDQINQSVRVTNSTGLLKVMRDYKHFFKVISYVLHEDEKIYGPDPTVVSVGITSVLWAYEYGERDGERIGWGRTAEEHRMASERMQNDYVKWGAREISADEFIKLSLLYVARGLHNVNGTAWNTGFGAFGRTGDASTNYGGSGTVDANSNFGVTSWDFVFKNFKDDLQDRCGHWKTFLTLNGKFWAGTNASNQYPQRYGGGDDYGWLDVYGPVDLPGNIWNGLGDGLYSGRITVGGDGDDMYWNNANNNVYVIYPTANMNVRWKNKAAAPLCEKIPYRGMNTALPYSGRGDERYQNDEWR